jgi:hypothetical protein
MLRNDLFTFFSEEEHTKIKEDMNFVCKCGILKGIVQLLEGGSRVYSFDPC